MLHRALASLCLPLAFGACVDSFSEGSFAVGVDPAEPCPESECPKNSARVASLKFHELDLSGVHANDAGMRVISFKTSWDRDLKIVGDEVRDTDGNVLAPGRLIGSRLRLTSSIGDYDIIIQGVDTTDYWVSQNTTNAHLYTLTYVNVNNTADKGDVCPSPWTSNDPDADGVQQGTAFLFTGDRYDMAAKTVIEPPFDGQWFNVACSGLAMAKLHLLRHTDAGKDATHITTNVQRQSMLKMLTDDICGTGFSFTVDGESVYYMDKAGWHPFSWQEVGKVEAIWNEKGAVCLETPRREKEEPGIRERIKKECGNKLPDPCGAKVASWRDHGLGITANPSDSAPGQ